MFSDWFQKSQLRIKRQAWHALCHHGCGQKVQSNDFHHLNVVERYKQHWLLKSLLKVGLLLDLQATPSGRDIFQVTSGFDEIHSYLLWRHLFCLIFSIEQYFRDAAVTMKCDYILGEYSDLMDAWKVYQGVALYRWWLMMLCFTFFCHDRYKLMLRHSIPEHNVRAAFVIEHVDWPSLPNSWTEKE